MITTTCLDSAAKKFTQGFPAEELSDYCGVERNVVWADVSDPTGKDFEELAEEFDFHPLSIEDCRNAHQRPKVEEYPGYYFMVLYEAELVGDDKDLELRELNIFLGKNYVVTVHSRPIRAIETQSKTTRLRRRRFSAARMRLRRSKAPGRTMFAQTTQRSGPATCITARTASRK